MPVRKRLMALAVVLLAVIAACSSADEPAGPPATGPTLTTVPPLQTAPPARTTPPGGSTTTSATTPRVTNPTVTAAPIDNPKPGVERFIPTLPLEDGILSLDVVFVDGTQSIVSWPVSLDLVSGGLIPYGWAFVAGGAARDFFIRPGTVESVLGRLGGARLVTEFFDDTGRTVGVWRPEADEVDYLGFRFGNWAVLVYDYRSELRMSDQHRSIWAANFHGEETERGFLTLSAVAPLELVYAGDYPVPLHMTLRGELGEVDLTPGPCMPGDVPGPGENNAFATWCNEAGNMTVRVYGPATFQGAVRNGLEVATVEIAVPPPKPEEEATEN